MLELLAGLVRLGTQVLQRSPAEEQNICMALLPPLLSAAAVGVRAAAARLGRRRAT